MPQYPPAILKNDYKNEGFPPNSKIIPDKIIFDVSELILPLL